MAEQAGASEVGVVAAPLVAAETDGRHTAAASDQAKAVLVGEGETSQEEPESAIGEAASMHEGTGGNGLSTGPQHTVSDQAEGGANASDNGVASASEDPRQLSAAPFEGSVGQASKGTNAPVQGATVVSERAAGERNVTGDVEMTDASVRPNLIEDDNETASVKQSEACEGPTKLKSNVGATAGTSVHGTPGESTGGGVSSSREKSVEHADAAGASVGAERGEGVSGHSSNQDGAQQVSADETSRETNANVSAESQQTTTKRKTPETTAQSNESQDASAETADGGSSAIKKQKLETDKQSSQSAAVVPSIASAPTMISRDEMAKMEEDDGVLKFDVITNDGTPEHMVQLTTLKNIFAKQLPKMPKEYIVRLVFDRNHRSMIILKNGKHVIGGICYRPFEPNHFAEIAFCAINASDQVKGYGTRLMNHLKEYVKTKGISHFLTYADNYAIGYFKKQGFSKAVSMPRPNWFGYIKDYDGGTLMECTIHHQINYLRITSMVHKQRQAILERIKAKSHANIVYPGLTKFAEGRLMDIYMIPGVKEAGWSQATIRNNRIGTRDPGSLKTQLSQLWKAVFSHRSAWPFHEPVDTNIVVDYLEHIKEPIDLTMIGKRVEAGSYLSKAQFKADLDRMCTNCTVYNAPDTNYYKAAVDLQEFINKRIQIREQPK